MVKQPTSEILKILPQTIHKISIEMLDSDFKESSPQDSDTSPVTTESNKKRVLLGIIVGGALFVGLIIAIIALVASAGVKYKPTPPKPKPVIVSYNPYVLISYHEDSRAKARAFIYNNRSMIENPTDPQEPTSFQPVVKNTTENLEPINLMVTFDQIDEHLLNVKYTDPEMVRWEVPSYSSDQDRYKFISERIRSPLGVGASQEGQGFFWKFYGKHYDMLPLITTEHCKLQYFDKYLEFEGRVQTDHIYGMGERISSFALKNGNYSLWNFDRTYEFGDDPSSGTHGSHPFFLSRLKDSDKFMGVFMRNSNAMLFSFWHSLNNGTYINYKMVGGIIDLYIFHAAEPDYILKKYHSLIGRPYLPPVWAMGFQQARRGYKLNDLKEVVQNYQKNKIPIDAVWADIEINDAGKAFTISSVDYNGVKEFVEYLHNPREGVDMHFVAIANPGIKAEKGFKYYELAQKDDCLIMSAKNHGKAFEGKTYAGSTVWLDFFMHEALLVWSEGLNDYYELTGLDGIWISMNEPSHNCNGECGYSKRITNEAKSGKDTIPDPFHNETEFDYIQYRPTIEPLETSTLPMPAFHHNDAWFGKQFYTHNLFGLQVTKATYESLRAHFEDKRFLLASRSTFPGSGHYGSHWIDQNYASWESLRASIPAMLNFNMFGIPHVGAPIGGFYGNVESELLIRWFELGAFSPLMLSYSNGNTNPKEAYALNDSIPIISKVFLERYSLLRFMYTKMFEAFAWGGAVVHPLFFDFPKDEMTYNRDIIDSSFMWAKTLYVIPALIKGQTRVKAYLPNWRWYDLKTLEMVVDHKDYGEGDYYIFDQPLGHITVLVKGGSIIPYQSLASAAKVMNVEDLKKIPVLIIIAPDHTGRAVGSMVTDAEGIRPHPSPMSNTYRHYGFTYMNQIFRINKIAGFDFHETYEFDYFWELILLDTFGQKQITFACYMDMNYHKKELLFYQAPGSSLLVISDGRSGKLPMANFESIVWGGPEQHDFCKFEAHLRSVAIENEGRTMLGEIATSDPEAYALKYDLTATLLTNKIISLQIAMDDPAHKNWIVPDVVSDEVRRTVKSTMPLSEAGFRTSPLHAPFAFEISSPEDSRDFVLTSRHFPFVYIKNYMHLKFMVNGRHLFGLGERIHSFELGDGIYSIFNNDATSEETGVPPGNNMWGSHAFYLVHLHNPHNFAGVFFLNSNPMDIRIRHVGMQTQVEHLFIGGIIDAFFFQGGSAEEVIRNYHYVIGRPAPVPYWGFGYHQCRWGYRGTEHIQIVEQGFAQANIPIDALWIDKDYMEEERDFTLDRKRWALLPKFVDLIHNKGIKFVALIDPALAIDSQYEAYREGLERNAFIMSSFTKEPLVGISWPGYSVYIDFVQPGAIGFWEDCLQKFKSVVDFDGLWLDMNEPSNFCDGECPDELHYKYYNFPLDFYDDLYYNPTHRPLEHNTISMEALHYGESHEPDFNYHNLYGFMQSRATARYFTMKIGKRPFILSSSTFPGSGRYVGHWLGDNYSAWRWMGLSLASVFNFQMFGIPFVGADICGFNGNTTISLCSRWMQLGAFYPMMRNHNSMFSMPQEPFIDAKLTSVSKKAIRTRYTLARYLYTLHMRTVLHGGMYFKPVMFEFPTDDKTYSILEETLMLGPALRMTPMLADKLSIIESYFPNHDWYEFSTLKQVMTYNHSAKYGKNLTLSASLDTEQINIHIKGGSIFMVHSMAAAEASIRINQMQNYPVDLIVAPHGASATGYAYFDSDETMEYTQGNYREYQMDLNNNVMQVNSIGGNSGWKYEKRDEVIEQIKVLGISNLENIRCAKMLNKTDGTTVTLDYEPKLAEKILIIKAKQGKEIRFSNIGNVGWYDTECQRMNQILIYLHSLLMNGQ
eukprot:TRINITY_DN135087_c3_g1_i1.p1 TRINITY_DN135087_c3_g1~~TRINITY_DN135087_c3_g1_i1.p1  ORF type:complete len:1866 (+),score=156.31 TRINITY_DN135087_c3_g1_i1:1756-7353(+)